MNWNRLRRGSVVLIAALALGTGLFEWLQRSRPTISTNAVHAATDPPKSTASNVVKVDVVKPRTGGMDRTCMVPGSIHAYESAELYAKVSGYLQKQNVDIGDRVESGQVLVELYSPELHREVDRGKAAVDRAQAQVGQMKARIVAAEADQHAAETGIARAEAGIKRDKAAFDFRNKQFRRFQELVQAKSVDERLVDEKEEQRLAAQAAVDASQATLSESHARSSRLLQQKSSSERADLVERRGRSGGCPGEPRQGRGFCRIHKNHGSV